MPYDSILDISADILRRAATIARTVAPPPLEIVRGGGAGPGVIYAANRNIVADRSWDQSCDAADLPYLTIVDSTFGLAVAQLLQTAADHERADHAAALSVWPDNEHQRADFFAGREDPMARNIARLILDSHTRMGR
ncbi:hypothetical protein [Kitasatospora sp. NPDC058046]|uniref:hypothetical protein n=1 Tax=Kitasatospora sp. NPDC058046 TaxID=3346312 RepID=UPI0036DA7204